MEYLKHIESKISMERARLQELLDERGRVGLRLEILLEMLAEARKKLPTDSNDQQATRSNGANPRETVRSATLRILQESARPMTTTEIGEQLKREREITKHAAYSALKGLMDKGIVGHRKQERGKNRMWFLVRKLEEMPASE